MNAISACLTDEETRLLASDRAPAARLPALEAHVDSCERCAAAHDRLLQPIISALRDCGEPDDGPEAALAAELAARLKALPRQVGASTVDATRAPTPDPAADGRGSGVRLDMLEPPQGPDELGRLGKFRVLEVLGRGGMGCVFRAEDTRLHRDVALKVVLLRRGRELTAGQRDRFIKEAKAAARLNHTNITPVWELDEGRNGTLYIAMPLLRGMSLDRRLAAGPRLTPSEVCHLGSQVADGLAAAHAAGIVHRDVKPSNVWVEPDGTARVFDFGLAKPEDDADASTPGAVVGTPSYMAPEQASAEPVDHRADLYSLGVVLYEMLSGERLFRGVGVTEVLTAVRRFRVPPAAELLPHAPHPLAELVAGLLARDPERRMPRTASEVGARLRELGAALDTGSGSTVDLGAPRPAGPGKRWVAYGVLVLAAGAIAAGVVLRVKKDDADPGTVVELPERSRSKVGPDGSVTVTLPAKPGPQPPAIPAAEASAQVWSPRVEVAKGLTVPTLDHLDRNWVHPNALAVAGNGDPTKAPAGVVAVLGHPPRDNVPGVGHAGQILAVALHPSGLRAATGGDDALVHLWDLAGPGPD